MKNKKKAGLIIAVCLVVVLAAVCLSSPIAFTKDGFLTRKEVDYFDTSYELGRTRRHGEEIHQIYLLCFGREEPVVKLEKNGTATEVELKKAGSFLYFWDWNVADGQAYQVHTKSENYYFTIVVT